MKTMKTSEYDPADYIETREDVIALKVLDNLGFRLSIKQKQVV